MDSKDVISTSYFLFEEIQREFDRLFQSGTVPNSNDNIAPLLRRCLFSLHLLESFDLGLVMEKCEILVRFLRKLCLYEPKASNGISPSVLGLLEVFINELVMHRPLRQYITWADTKSTETDHNLLEPSENPSYLRLIQELLSHHFLLSYPSKSSFPNLMPRLPCKSSISTPLEISLDAVLALLGFDASISMPGPIQAHLLQLASRCFETQNPNLEHSLLGFEISANIYFRYLHCMDFTNNIMIKNIAKNPQSGHCKKSPYSLPRNLSHRTDEILSFCNPSTDFDVNDVFSYIEENQCIVHEDFRHKTGLILKSIVSRFCNQLTETQGPRRKITQEMICLVSALKLMGVSLLRVLSHFREIKRKEEGFDRIKGVICNFEEFEVDRIFAEILADVADVGPARRNEKRSLVVLRHFACLLVRSVGTRINFLWKGFVFMIMAVMDLIVYEEENLDSFRVLFENNTSSRDETPEGKIYRRSSERIASQYREIRRVYLKNEAKSLLCDDKRCDGRAYIECLPEFQRNPLDWDDLLDFIECQHDKDYTAWLRKREKFRSWRYEKRRSKRVSKRIEAFASSFRERKCGPCKRSQ